jgi:hypothetical protein
VKRTVRSQKLADDRHESERRGVTSGILLFTLAGVITGRDAVDAQLWNICVKVKDVQAEADYFVELGGGLSLHERCSRN